MSEKASEITVQGEWVRFVGDNFEAFGDTDAAIMWTAGFASALQLMLRVHKLSSTRGEFAQHMRRLQAEAEAALQRGSDIQ